MKDTDIADVASIEPFIIETTGKIIEEQGPEVPLQKEIKKRLLQRDIIPCNISEKNRYPKKHERSRRGNYIFPVHKNKDLTYF